MADVDEEEIEGEFVDSEEQDGERIARIKAALAEKEREALEAIKEDICQWLFNALKPFNITPPTFMESLDTGVALCKLTTLIQQSAKSITAEKKLDITVPMEALSCNEKAESGTFFARDNASNFISWCRKLGVEESVIFESDGLVSHTDEKRVILCLLDVARFAEKVGIAPPQLVKMEQEIEELEKAEKEAAQVKNENEPLSSPTKIKQTLKTSSPSPVVSNEKTKNSPQSAKKEPRPSKIPRRITRTSVKVKRDESKSVSPQPRSISRIPRKRTREGDSDSELQSSSKTKRLKTEEKEDKQETNKETMDEKVMRRMGECHCDKKLEVTNCGKGKFIVKAPSGKNITLYARMLSDRVMVRVGGGWDTLDHFLLKHDPLIAPPTGMRVTTGH